MDLSYIGDNLKNRRKELGLTQTKIKELTGISSGNMSDLENGNKLPSCQTLILLSDAFQCSVDFLLRGNSHHCEKQPIALLTDDENELLDSYNSLSIKDKEDILEYIRFKEFKTSHKEKKPLNQKEKFTNSDYNSNGGSEIA